MHRSAIIHIGTEKTGSTSIQRVLSKKRECLSKLGFWYASSPGPENHFDLARFAAPENTQDPTEGIFDRGEFESNFSNEMKSLPAHIANVIFSSEYCHSRVISNVQVDRLSSLLSPYIDNIEVVVYLRRQDEMACSAYSNCLRLGDPWDDILPQLSQEDPVILGFPYNIMVNYFDIVSLLERYSAVFGRASINPRIFEVDLLERGDVVTDFLLTCKIPEWVGHGAERLNRGVPAEGRDFLVLLTGYLRDLQRGGSDISSEVLRVCSSILETSFIGSPELPSRSEAEAFYSRFVEGNEQVRKEWFPERATLFSEDFSRYPTEKEIPASSRRANAFRAAFVLIEELVRERERLIAEEQARTVERAEIIAALEAAKRDAISLRESTSWRLTKPLRAMLDRTRGLR